MKQKIDFVKFYWKFNTKTVFQTLRKIKPHNTVSTLRSKLYASTLKGLISKKSEKYYASITINVKVL